MTAEWQMIWNYLSPRTACYAFELDFCIARFGLELQNSIRLWKRRVIEAGDTARIHCFHSLPTGLNCARSLARQHFLLRGR